MEPGNEANHGIRVPREPGNEANLMVVSFPDSTVWYRGESLVSLYNVLTRIRALKSTAG